MYSKLLLVVACAALLAAPSNNKGKIEDTFWKSKAFEVDGKEISAGVITLDFRRDGGMSFVIGDNIYRGKYELGEGDEVTFYFDKELDGEKIHVETVRIQGNDMTVTDTDGVKIKFTKSGQ